MTAAKGMVESGNIMRQIRKDFAHYVKYFRF